MNDKPLFFNRVNWLGFWSFYYKEVKRFITIPTQTILAPIITSLLFLSVFQLAVGRLNATVGNLDFIVFLVPGLIMMQLIQNSFTCTSSAITSGKMLGAIYDVLSPPLSSAEILVGFTGAAITRGVIVSASNGFAMSFFVDLSVYSWGYLIIFAVLGSALMGIVGIVAGLWAEKWDHISAITAYIIAPMSFLSGTFYSIHQLPEKFQGIAQLNPFFYMVDGFRYSMTGQSDANLTTSIIVVGGLTIIMFIITKILLDKGWKVKS